MDSNLAFQDERWEELINGDIVMMAPAAVNHVLVGGNIYRIFANFLQGKSCVPIGDGVLVYFTEQDHFSPDFMVVCDRQIIKPDGIYGAPDLVVEILSPSTAKNDRGHKKEIYEKCGVREYWIVSPSDKMVEQYILQDGKFLLRETYAVMPEWMLERMKPEEREKVVSSFKCSLYDDLTISLDDIFARVI